jgi:hypothetical protein
MRYVLESQTRVFMDYKGHLNATSVTSILQQLRALEELPVNLRAW